MLWKSPVERAALRPRGAGAVRRRPSPRARRRASGAAARCWPAGAGPHRGSRRARAPRATCSSASCPSPSSSARRASASSASSQAESTWPSPPSHGWNRRAQEQLERDLGPARGGVQLGQLDDEVVAGVDRRALALEHREALLGRRAGTLGQLVALVDEARVAGGDRERALVVLPRGVRVGQDVERRDRAVAPHDGVARVERRSTCATRRSRRGGDAGSTASGRGSPRHGRRPGAARRAPAACRRRRGARRGSARRVPSAPARDAVRRRRGRRRPRGSALRAGARAAGPRPGPGRARPRPRPRAAGPRRATRRASRTPARRRAASGRRQRRPGPRGRGSRRRAGRARASAPAPRRPRRRGRRRRSSDGQHGVGLQLVRVGVGGSAGVVQCCAVVAARGVEPCHRQERRDAPRLVPPRLAPRLVGLVGTTGAREHLAEAERRLAVAGVRVQAGLAGERRAQVLLGLGVLPGPVAPSRPARGSSGSHPRRAAGPRASTARATVSRAGTGRGARR